MKVRWLAIAIEGRRIELRYIAERHPRASLELGDAIQEAIGNLADHPEIGRIGRVRGTRELVIGRTPYLVAYRVSEDTVTIVRFLHGARRWPKRL